MGSLRLNGRDLLGQLEAFRKSDLERHELTEELIKRVSELEIHLERVTSDLEDQSSLRRDYKNRAEHAEKAISRKPYILVLIDADGYIFNSKYLTDVESGGIDAAHALRTAVARYFQREHTIELRPECEIMANVYANQRGLGKAMADAGLVSESAILDNFICKWNQSHPLFVWADCGPGKERVDAKIREAYRFHAYQPSCQAIFLACCHDNGYVAEFEKYRRDDLVSNKTILVKATMPARGFADLTFRKCDFGSVFHDELLKTKQLSNSLSLPMRPASLTQPVSLTSTVRPMSDENIALNKTYSSAAADFPIAIPSQASNKAESVSPKPASPASGQDRIPVNRSGQRIDARLKHFSEQDGARFYERIGDWKLCNAYFLANNCRNGDRCQFDHSPIDDGIKLVLRHTARQIVCKNGASCRDRNCYFGHQCPFHPDCYAKKCFFRTKDLCGIDHNVAGTVPAA